MPLPAHDKDAFNRALASRLVLVQALTSDGHPATVLAAIQGGTTPSGSIRIEPLALFNADPDLLSALLPPTGGAS